MVFRVGWSSWGFQDWRKTFGGILVIEIEEIEVRGWWLSEKTALMLALVQPEDLKNNAIQR